MAGRRTNLALLVLVLVAFLTGVSSWTVGAGWVAAIVVVHAIAGLAIVVLAPWKGMIARRGLARRRPGRATGVLLAGLSVVCVVTGLVHAVGWIDVRGPLSPLGIHVGTGVAVVAVGVAHVVQRPVRPRATDLTRRNLLRTGALAAGAGVAVVGFEGLLRATGARGAERRSTGSHETGSFDADRMPVTQWLDDPVPSIDPADWQLHVTTGETSRTLALADLERSRDHVRALLDCTGGWFATQDWQGARLDRLLTGASGSSVLVRSATGYARRFPLADAPTMLLATRIGDEPLSAGHGAPARLVVPGRRGYWWVKWVTEVRVDDTPWWWQPPLPLT